MTGLSLMAMVPVLEWRMPTLIGWRAAGIACQSLAPIPAVQDKGNSN